GLKLSAGSNKRAAPKPQNARTAETKKLERQPKLWVNKPPITGPMVYPMADIAPPAMRMARPRSATGNNAVTRAKLLAMMSALPAACTARKITSCTAFWDEPAAIELNP